MFCFYCLAAIYSVPVLQDQSPESYPGNEYEYQTARPFATLYDSSQGGCVICRNLWDKHGERARDGLVLYLAFHFTLAAGTGICHRSPEKTWHHAIIYICYHNGLERHIGNDCHVKWSDSLAIYNSLAFQNMTGYKDLLINNDPNCVPSMTIANLWYDECITHHRDCQQVSTARPWTPTRLIKIGNTDDIYDSDLSPRLVVMSNVDIVKSRQYSTLTHMWWGVGNFLQLRRENLASLQDHIHFDDLSSDCKYAINVSRSLGLMYIWIDCLCIIQDDQEDWTLESPKMHDIYANTACNIALLSPQAAVQGIALRPRILESLILSDSEGIEFDNGTSRYSLINPNYWIEQVESEPLFSRAWVIQELLLSPRILFLSEKALFWKCSTAQKSEKFPRAVPSWFGTSAIPRHAQFSELVIFSPSRPLYQTVDYWAVVVEKYTTCDLTYQTDKLIAIAGIAESFHIPELGEYIAGLWEKNLAISLLWCSENPMIEQPGPSCANQYRAPSFSWASLDNPIRYFMMGYPLATPSATVLQFHLNRLGGMFGLVEGGFLRMRGKVKELMLKKGIRPERLYLRPMTDRFLPVLSDEEWSINGISIAQYHSEKTDEREVDSLFVRMDRINPGKSTKRTVFCLTISEGETPHHFTEKCRWATGLLLEPIDGAIGVFKRVGIFSAGGATLCSLLLDWDEFDACIPCEEYDADSGQHTIVII